MFPLKNSQNNNNEKNTDFNKLLPFRSISVLDKENDESEEETSESEEEEPN